MVNVSIEIIGDEFKGVKDKVRVGWSMQNISSVVGKLLFFSRHLHQTRQINQMQLGSLKDMILSDNEDVGTAYQAYQNHGTELTLTASLIRLTRHQKDSESDGDNSQSSSKKNKRGNISILIPKRNIQKMPAGMNRV